MLLVQDKWDTYVVDNPGGDELAALDLVRKRLDDEFWYENLDDGDPRHQWEDRARLIADQGDGLAALNFLMERCDHEYEYVEVVGSGR